MGLSIRHARLLLTSLLVLITVRIALSVSGYRKVSEHIRLAPGTRQSANPVVAAWAIRHCARLVPKASCLTQALSLQYLLARSGQESLVRVGAAESVDGRFEAHAWLICEDRVIIGGVEEDISRFRPIVDLKPKAA